MVKIGTKAEDKPPESLKNPEDVTAKNIFDPSDFVYSICKEDLNSFLSRTIYFGWAYTIAGTAIHSINSVIQIILVDQYLLIAVPFLLYLILRKFLASDAHIRFIYNSSVRFRESNGLSNSSSRNANIAKFDVNGILIYEILFLYILSAGIKQIIIDLFGLAIKEATHWKTTLAFMLCISAFYLVIFVTDYMMREIIGRNKFGEMNEANVKGDSIEKRSKVFSTIATHFGTVWGLDDITPAGGSAFIILIFPATNMHHIGVITEDDFIELSVLSILKCLVVMLTGFLIFLLIQTVINILNRRPRTVRMRKAGLEELESGQHSRIAYGSRRPSFVFILDAGGQNGIRRGDQIISVNGIDVEGLSLLEISQLFKFPDSDTLVVQYNTERAIHMAKGPIAIDHSTPSCA